MKLRALQIGLFLVIASIHVFGQDDQSQMTEQKRAAQPTVTVFTCSLSGNISVRGWDRNEVAVRSSEGAQIQLKRGDSAAESVPAAKLQVVVIDQNDVLRTRSGCQAASDIEMNVPRGATVQVQTRDGSVSIVEVARAYAGTQNGDIQLEKITQVLEVGTIGGNVDVKDSSGRMDLNSISGNVMVVNARPADSSDAFEVTTVSGDLELEKVSHAQMNLRTVNGSMKMIGPLVSGGQYGINTMSGDVTLALPADASFQLNAKVSAAAEIITDFALTLIESVSVGRPAIAPSPAQQPASSTAVANPTNRVNQPQAPVAAAAKPAAPVVTVKPVEKIKTKPESKGGPVILSTIHALRRVSAVCGTGDATISVASFSGTLHLQKN